MSASNRRESQSRNARLQQIVDECIERRATGNAVPDVELITAHPDLMPELGEELKNLAIFEKAQRRADATETSPVGSALNTAVPMSDSFPGYESVNEIRRGGQGVVYRAIQKSTKRNVALKVLLEGPYASESARKRFQREIELVA